MRARSRVLRVRREITSTAHKRCVNAELGGTLLSHDTEAHPTKVKNVIELTTLVLTALRTHREVQGHDSSLAQI